MFDKNGVMIQGHIKIFDPVTGQILQDKSNAIHYENMSEALALGASNKGYGYITEMHFGNGGTTVDPTGVITYLPTNTNVQNADLYSPQYSKIIDNNNAANTDPARNNITILHTPGLVYTDILVSCLLDYGEPNISSPGNLLGANQAAFDSTTNNNSGFVFDELGLRGRSIDGTDGLTSTGLLLTHVVFMPVQKSLNRLIQIDYTVRIQSLTGLTG